MPLKTKKQGYFAEELCHSACRKVPFQCHYYWRRYPFLTMRLEKKPIWLNTSVTFVLEDKSDERTERAPSSSGTEGSMGMCPPPRLTLFSDGALLFCAGIRSGTDTVCIAKRHSEL